MNKFVVLIILLLLFSCSNKEKKQQISFAPKTVEAKGHWQNPDSFAKPIAIPAGVPVTVNAGQPKVIPTHLNVHIAGEPQVIPAGQPKICTPGADTFSIPKTISSNGKTKPAGLPEVVIAKDAASKDQNPANFSVYKTLQGLKHNSIRCMLQDKTGNLWFGTFGGVSRYDGKSFTNFTDKDGLSSNVVYSILEDKNGNLWFGTDGGGVSRYDGKSFTNFTDKEGLANNTVNSILEDKNGNLWFGTNGGGVSRYDGNRVEEIEAKIKRGETISEKDQLGIKKENGMLVKSFTNFTNKEGLANNFVLSILEDKTGNLWFGTYGGGVSCYDGNRVEEIEARIKRGVTISNQDQIGLNKENGKLIKSFTNYTDKEGLANNGVNSILEDKNGDLWFGTNGGGVSHYDGISFTNYTDKEGLANNVVNSILEDKNGNLWFGTNGGAVSRYDGNRVEKIEARIKRGELISEWDQLGLKKTNGKLVKSFTNFTDKDGLLSNVVYSILEDKTGNLWFGTYGGGASRYDGKSFTNFTDKEGLADNVVYSILEDKTGKLWFGTGNGVCRYDGKSFTNYTDKEGLGNNYGFIVAVWSILEDKNGNLWFGTYGWGVSRYDGNRIEEIEDRIKRGETISERDQLGLKKENGKLVKSFNHYTDKEGLANNVVNTILEDKNGNLWFGTNGGGVSRYDGNRVEEIEARINRGVTISERDQLGLKKENGMLVKSFTNFTEKEGLANNVVLSILEDKNGNLWFGTYGGGVSRYDGKSFTNFTEKDGLANNVVWSILEDETGNLWFGTNAGVSRFDGNSITNFTDKDGLANNAVLNLMQDKEGNIWFGTRKGLSRLSATCVTELASLNFARNENFDPIKEGLFYNYGYNDGFLGLSCRRNSVLQDSKGRIWWGTDMLICYDPKGDVIDTSPPVVQLNSIELFGENIAWANLGAVNTDSTGKEILNGKIADTLLANGVLLKNIRFDGITKWYSLPEKLSLSYNNNNLTFSFIGIHMQSRNHIKYQFKLEGLDPDWSSITERTEAPYGNLPPGEYTFKVKAMNQSGVWSEPFEFKFQVRPPWWQTWWFRMSMGAIIVGSIIVYIKWRERELKERQKELEVKVDEATLEIKEQKYLIEEKHKEITDSINYAERIQRSFLATQQHLNANLNEYFVLFRPKDVVSGDFYWSATLENGQFALATADSTGHGVPGAIMSLLNISSLELAVKDKLTEPDKILNYSRTEIINRLKKDGSSEGGKDGMDCSLCVYDFKNMKLQLAAAHNPVWIMRGEEVIEIKADKMPVGKHDKQDIPFTLQSIDLQKGDAIYTLTDGFPDQFGGEKGKKFMSKALRELLAKNTHLPLQEQKALLEKTFADWIGNLEQVDDVTIVGVRI